MKPSYRRLILRLTTVFLSFLVSSESRSARIIDCSSCHGTISSEWRISAHAGSYSSPLFLHELAKSEDSPATSCACHAPDFFVTGGIGRAPGKRADDLHLGIDCLACHMDKEMVAWADSRQYDVPHWVRDDKRYLKAIFCAGCHTWAKDAAVDCQDCHMPEQKGPVTDHPIFGRTGGSTHRSHSMHGLNDPEFLTTAAALEVGTNGKRLEISLSNLIPVHAFPQIRHRLAELAVVEEKNGRRLWTEQVRLAADSTADYKVELPGRAEPLVVELRLYPSVELRPDSSLLVAREVVKPR